MNIPFLHPERRDAQALQVKNKNKLKLILKLRLTNMYSTYHLPS